MSSRAGTRSLPGRRLARREVVLVRTLDCARLWAEIKRARGCQRVLRHVWAVLAGGGGVVASGGGGALGGVVEAVRLRGGRGQGG